jgi:superfamily I DNA/RNA helicase
VLLSAPADAGVERLRRHALGSGRYDNIRCASLGRVAFEIVRDERLAAGGAAPESIDDVRASQHFEAVGASLFSLDWTEFVGAEMDPEITGLRAPERFSAAAFRLIRKLRAALISPEEFKRLGLQGAMQFCGKPPNFTSTELLIETPEKYRDSLRVNAAELERQYEREVDLVKILARLYESYVAALVEHGCLTPGDAIYEAVCLVRKLPRVRERARGRFAGGLIDDAQDLTPGQTALLQALFGDELATVTLAGDADQATRGFATGARGAEVLKRAQTIVPFETNFRSPAPIVSVAQLVLHEPALANTPATSLEPDAVVLYRAGDQREEARYVADEVVNLLAQGMRPAEIAVIARNLACAHVYVDALLARDVPVDVAGEASLYVYPVVADALAALWAAADPFRHDYLLRNLEAPWLNLCDASIATLCGDAAEPQPLLFELESESDSDVRPARWDRRRALRLGRNVTRGDVDAELPAEARERLLAFREARERWADAARRLTLPALVRLVLGESVLATLPLNARGRFDESLVARLIDEAAAFAAREPLGSLDDFLAYAGNVASAEADLLALARRDGAAVGVLDVEAAKGEEYEAVFLVDVRAGAWPRYYVPDAFLFMPSAGMIPKDNVGDAAAARTAKFTYAFYRYKLRERYNREERRTVHCAATRARRRLFVSASGRPTKGVSAPEILEELERHAR